MKHNELSGRLPNTVTPEGMRRGLRYARNQTLVNVMRDYACMEARGMACPTDRQNNAILLYSRAWKAVGNYPES